MGNGFMTVREKSSVKRRVKRNIIDSYHRWLSIPPDRVRQYLSNSSLSALDVITLKSTILALEDPESGESHRIMNRVWGRPAETKLHLHKIDDPSESPMARQLAELRRSVLAPIDAEVEIVTPKEIIEAAKC